MGTRKLYQTLFIIFVGFFASALTKTTYASHCPAGQVHLTASGTLTCADPVSFGCLEGTTSVSCTYGNCSCLGGKNDEAREALQCSPACLSGFTCVIGSSGTSSSCVPNPTSSKKGAFLDLITLGPGQANNTLAETFFQLLYRALLPIAILIGMLLLVSSGYKLISSQGDPQKVMEAKEDLTSAIMGIIFIILGVSLLRVIISTLIGV